MCGACNESILQVNGGCVHSAMILDYTRQLFCVPLSCNKQLFIILLSSFFIRLFYTTAVCNFFRIKIE